MRAGSPRRILDPMSVATRPPAIEEALKDAKKRLFTAFGARLVELRLFGSVARGEATEGSDVDLLVVLDRVTSSHERFVAMDAVIDAGLAHELVLEPTVLGADELAFLRKRETAFVQALDREGISL